MLAAVAVLLTSFGFTYAAELPDETTSALWAVAALAVLV